MIVLKPYFPGILYPLEHPRIGWRKALGTIAASTEAAGFDAANAGTDRTDSFWKATALPATWTVTLASAQVLSYAGIAAHDIATEGATVFFETWDGAAWVTQGNTTPSDNSTIFFLFNETETTQYRVRITGTDAPHIGVIRAGRVMEFPRLSTYSPSVSFERSQETSYNTNLTDGGQWAGRSVTRRELRPRMDVDHLPEEWIQDEFEPFREAARVAPFFIADRPSQYPASVAYAFATAEITPDRQQPNRRIANSVTLELQGFRSRD
jgi:hypothetical protein